MFCMLKNKKIILAVLALIVFGLVIFILVAVSLYNSFLSSHINTSLDLEIKKGSSKNQVVSLICENRCDTGFNSLFLKIYLYLNPNIVFEAGNYSFNENTTYLYLLNNIKKGTIQQKVTFLEGWSVEENAYYLKSVLGSEFATKYYEGSTDLQGKIYPNTYFVDASTTPEKLINKQITEYSKLTEGIFTNTTLNENEVLTIASIVQREAMGEQDRYLIAGILVKRYLEGMPLDADATNQYAVFLNTYPSFLRTCITSLCEDPVFWVKNLTEDDLKINSLYNTRGKVGLPPKPICNPAIESIKAVITPEKSSYYYYLHDTKGNTYYAETLEQHIANINNFL